MKLKYLAFYGAFLILYILINYFIALRGWQSLSSSYPGWARLWIASVGLAALLFPLGRWLSQFLPHDLSRPLIIIGSYWLGIMYYLLLIILTLDFMRLLNRWLNFLPQEVKSPHPMVALGIVLILLALNLYGTWNANHPLVRHYELSLKQKSSTLDTVRVVMVSDIHLGWIIGVNRLNLLVDSVNALHPDLVLLAGDIVDEGVDLSTQAVIPQTFSRLNSRFGTYAIPGNHEYISRQVYKVGEYLNAAGVRVLRDHWIKLDNAFYLVGRDDLTRGKFSAVPRQDLSALMLGINRDELPILLMDHQPFNLKEPAAEGVDLQFSGHTHRGQFFPNNLITHALFEQDWGYFRQDNLQLIVSCGFGTWGPPIRIGNRPEIIEVLIHFVPDGQHK